MSVNGTSASPWASAGSVPFGHERQHARRDQAPLQGFSARHLLCHRLLLNLLPRRLSEELLNQLALFPLQLYMRLTGRSARETGVHAPDAPVTSQDDRRGKDGKVDQLRQQSPRNTYWLSFLTPAVRVCIWGICGLMWLETFIRASTG